MAISHYQPQNINDSYVADRCGSDPAFATWHKQRLEMEAAKKRHSIGASPGKRLWPLFVFIVHLLGFILRITLLFKVGFHNALRPRLERQSFTFANLPKAFDGYRILHISDPHFDGLPAVVNSLLSLTNTLDYDLVIFTGDYCAGSGRNSPQAMALMGELVAKLSATDGIVAILGNHDRITMVESLANMGVKPLINETVTIKRGDSMIHVSGTDDVYYYFTSAALDCLENSPSGFKVAAVHSPHLAMRADHCDYDLYLTGHTHGGQVCLPGGIPVVTHRVPHRFASGPWRLGGLQGYTSRGSGTSGLSVRFNCPGEITLITLKSSSK